MMMLTGNKSFCSDKKALHEGQIKVTIHPYILRMLLAYIMIPVVEKEVNDFKDIVWNTHRIRAQKDAFLPNGIPNHVYSFPGKNGLEECGMPSYITEIKVISLNFITL